SAASSRRRRPARRPGRCRHCPHPCPSSPRCAGFRNGRSLFRYMPYYFPLPLPLRSLSAFLRAHLPPPLLGSGTDCPSSAGPSCSSPPMAEDQVIGFPTCSCVMRRRILLLTAFSSRSPESFLPLSSISLAVSVIASVTSCLGFRTFQSPARC